MSLRVTPNPLPDLLASIQRSQQNANVATQELASGRSVNQLSDDPAAASQLVGNRDQSARDDRFLQNLSTLQSRFQVADSTFSDVVSALTRAVSLGTQGANGTLNASDRQAIAGEVQGLITQMLSLANTTYQGAYLFSGTAVNTQPFTQSGATVTYNGNVNTTSVDLSDGNSIQGNVPGDQLFQNSGGSVFTSLGNLNAALQSGNNIGAALTQVQNALSTVSTQRVFYGNALNQIKNSESFLNQDKINLSAQGKRHRGRRSRQSRFRSRPGSDRNTGHDER